MKQLFFFAIISSWFIFVPVRASAWWIQPHEAFPVPHDDGLNTINNLHPFFVMLDNPLYRSSREINSPLLSCDTKNFAAIIRIDARIPLNALSRRDISTRETLDAILYADLEMRQLMEELLRLKKRTSILLDKTSIPYLRKTASKDTDPTRNPQAESLKNEYEILKRKKASLKIAEFRDIRHGAPLPTNQKDSKTIHSIQKNISPGEPDSFDMDAPEIVNSNIHRSEELPWLFRVSMAVVRYALKNRFETLFYGAIIFMIFYFISFKIRDMQ